MTILFEFFKLLWMDANTTTTSLSSLHHYIIINIINRSITTNTNHYQIIFLLTKLIFSTLQQQYLSEIHNNSQHQANFFSRPFHFLVLDKLLFNSNLSIKSENQRTKHSLVRLKTI